MKNILSQKIICLAEKLSSPLYVVGGACRDFLLGEKSILDVDLSSPCLVDEITSVAKGVGIEVVACYPRTNTVVLFDGQRKYEFTSFRKDVYGEGGAHKPLYTQYTSDIMEDALRRDFKCNALYFDVKKSEFVDVLGSINDINNKIISAVKAPSEVFSHDGLRLMRLARFCGELGFSPDEQTILGAKQNCDKIIDISKERIFVELQRILLADKKHSFSPQKGHYLGLKVLDEIGVLKIILPELSAGKGLKQRQDFHCYDVLEHSFRAVLYAREDVRLSALLHDVGKPYAFNKDGNFYQHSSYGETLVVQILNRLKAPKKMVEEVKFLTNSHMLDLDLSMGEIKIRRFIVNNYKYIDKLLALKQADFSASKDDLATCKTVEKWRGIINKMLADGTPFTIKDLKISSKELIGVGVKGRQIGELQKKMLEECVMNPSLNNREKLLKIALNSVK